MNGTTWPESRTGRDDVGAGDVLRTEDVEVAEELPAAAAARGVRDEAVADPPPGAVHELATDDARG